MSTVRLLLPNGSREAKRPDTHTVAVTSLKPIVFKEELLETLRQP